jgi:hypothetical protein
VNPTVPQTLNDAIIAQPAGLKAWVLALVLVHLVAVLFVATRAEGRWRVRFEPIAIIVSFVAAAAFMNWLYFEFGYVRLLGLAHLLFWTPAYLWVALTSRRLGAADLFGKYLILYLIIAGISLLLDAADVVRYLIGNP